MGKGKGKAEEDVDGHTDEVWVLALSPDGRLLESGGKDRKVGVWDVEKDVWVKGFKNHRQGVSVRIVSSRLVSSCFVPVCSPSSSPFSRHAVAPRWAGCGTGATADPCLEFGK